MCAILCPAAYAGMRCEPAMARFVLWMLSVSRFLTFALGALLLLCGCGLPAAAIQWERAGAPAIGLQLVPAALLWTCGWLLLYGAIHL